jgi:hypothetical protein
MPFTDPVSSISGRNSRASNVSAATGASRSLRSPAPAGVGVDMMANAGVLSMLKTTTDTGDIGALSFNQYAVSLWSTQAATFQNLWLLSSVPWRLEFAQLRSIRRFKGQFCHA